MTTVVIAGNEIAYDSRKTRHEYVVSDECEKAKVIDGVTFIFIGSVCDFDALAALYLGKPPEKDIKYLGETTAVVIDKGKLFYLGVNHNESSGWEIIKTPIEDDCAYGSGYAFALGALDAGFDAEEALHIAIKRDVWSGGHVRVINLGKDGYTTRLGKKEIYRHSYMKTT